MFGALDLRHQQRHPLRRRGNERRQRLARARKFHRIDRGARHRERAFEMTGRFRRQRLDPHQPLPRGIAEFDVRIGIREIGMRMRQPRGFHDPHRTPDLMRLALVFAGEHGGRHQGRRQFDGFHHAVA